MIKVKALGTDSSGNSYVINSGNQKIILDAGVSIKSLKKGIDFDLINTVGCLITHSHKDHSNSVQALLDSGIDCYMTKETAYNSKINHYRNHIISYGIYQIGEFEVHSFPVYHDCAGACGFYIKHPKGNILYATDTFDLNMVDYDDIDYMLVECNHSEDLLVNSVEKGIITLDLSQRISETHLSLERLKIFLERINKENLKKIVLIHLSENNSNSELFKKEISKFGNTEVAENGNIYCFD